MPCIDTVEDIDKFEIQVRKPAPKPLKNTPRSPRVAHHMVLGMMHAWVAHGIPSQSDETATGLYTHTVSLKPCNELAREADCPTAVAVLTHQTLKAKAPTLNLNAVWADHREGLSGQVQQGEQGERNRQLLCQETGPG